MLERILGVFKLDKNVFAEIEHDQNATSEAAIIVAIVALLSAIGSGIGARMAGGHFLIAFIFAFIWAFVSWVIWAAVTFFVGTTLFGGESDMGEMLRVMGYAQAPMILAVIPCIGGIIGLIWSLIAAFIAIQEGLDLDTAKTAITALVAFVLIQIIDFAIRAALGISAAGFGRIVGMLRG